MVFETLPRPPDILVIVLVLVCSTGYLGMMALCHPHYTRHYRVDPVFRGPYSYAPSSIAWSLGTQSLDTNPLFLSTPST